MRARSVFVVAAALLTLSGCEAIHRHEAGSTENLLSAAGFQMRVQDLSAMPPLKIVARSRNNDVTYTFADPYTCRCLYVGGAKEYSAYQYLVEEQQIARERIWAEEDAMNWALWSPWYWR